MAKQTSLNLMERAWQWRRDSFDLPLSSKLARLQAANQLMQEAINVAVANNEEKNAAQAVHLLANLESDVGHLETAEYLWSFSVDLCRELGDAAMLAHKIRHLGDLYLRLKQVDRTIDCYEESLQLYQSIDARDSETILDFANLLVRYATIKKNLQKLQEAIDYFTQAEAMYIELNIEDGSNLCKVQINALEGLIR
jgi:tetratricopeptide (TPR) repeat protein